MQGISWDFKTRAFQGFDYFPHGSTTLYGSRVPISLVSSSFCLSFLISLTGRSLKAPKMELSAMVKMALLKTADPSKPAFFVWRLCTLYKKGISHEKWRAAAGAHHSPGALSQVWDKAQPLEKEDESGFTPPHTSTYQVAVPPGLVMPKGQRFPVRRTFHTP